MQATYLRRKETRKSSPEPKQYSVCVCVCVCVDVRKQQQRKKRCKVEANWTVRNASVYPLQRNPDSCKEDTSGHLIMQIPKVRWPLQPRGTLSVSARLYTRGGPRTVEETGNRAEDPAYAAHTHTQTSYWYLPLCVVRF